MGSSHTVFLLSVGSTKDTTIESVRAQRAEGNLRPPRRRDAVQALWRETKAVNSCFRQAEGFCNQFNHFVIGGP